jgi:D-beta-D-heptose 7-phosphate kinase / D-beta-D-heptose 1-phosphate adenosyltransferase
MAVDEVEPGPVDEATLLASVAAHRRAGRRVVFTNGCFDLIHRGHVRYLRQARALGDVLVVAANSDASVARIKGPGRPVNSVEDRCAVLAALAAVDHVVIFDEDTPVRLVAAVQPDVYVKGGDYGPDDLPEADIVKEYGGQVRILQYLPGRSTTEILQRL